MRGQGFQFLSLRIDRKVLYEYIDEHFFRTEIESGNTYGRRSIGGQCNLSDLLYWRGTRSS